MAAQAPVRRTHCFRSPSPEITRAVGAALARAWRSWSDGAGLVLSLTGALGAGKTVFVKGLGEGLGLEGDPVASPTFVLANQYPAGEFALHHVDFYRIEEAAELEGMGFFDLMEPGAILAVEWGERFGHALPQERIDLVWTVEAEGTRRLDVQAQGDRPCALLTPWIVEVERIGPEFAAAD